MASGSTPLAAVIVSGYEPSVPTSGVPARVAVPLPLSTKVTPEGSGPVSLRAGVGNPVVVTVNVLSMPTANAVVAALVIAGACVSVKTTLSPA